MLHNWLKSQGYRTFSEQQINSIIEEIKRGEFIFTSNGGGSIITFTTQEFDREKYR